MRTPLLAANWKMNTSPEEARSLVQKLLEPVSNETGIEVLICPPFTSLAAVSEVVQGSRIALGAQNIHYEDKGAFTGEIAAPMVAGMCQYVILGHSERRTLFGETDQIVNLKIKAAIRHKLNPVLCVGESLEDNESGRTAEVITAQISQSLAGITADDAAGLVIAYEPIWAIGTGRAPSGEQAGQTIETIRNSLISIISPHTADTTRILYGGSANLANISEFASQPQIDGALVGGASLSVADFVGMAWFTSQSKGVIELASICGYC